MNSLRNRPMQALPYIFLSVAGGLSLASFMTSATIF